MEDVETDDISGCEQSSVVENLRDGEGEVLFYQLEKVRTYGVDLSSLVELLWNLTPRPQQVDDELERLFCLARDRNSHKEAREMLEQLRSKYPNVADLTRAEVMLHLLS